MGEEGFVADEKLRRVSRREVKRYIANVHQHVYVADHEERHRRRAVEPRREPARALIAASMPEVLVETAAAMAADRAMPVEVVVEKAAASQPVADDEFNFFS